MPELDFDQERRALRDEIEMPAFADIAVRAATIRRRRRTGSAVSAVLVFVVLIGTGITLSRAAKPDPVAPADVLPAGSVWRGGPITLHGLNGPVLDLPGEVREVQFADESHGYALATDCGQVEGQPCTLALAASTDGGYSWRAWQPPFAQAPADRIPRLFTVDSTGVVLSGESTWFGRYGGGWQRVDTAAVPTAAGIGDGRLGLAPTTEAGPGCAARPLWTWRSDGSVRSLATQPHLSVCWAAAAPTSDGSWWVGGIAGGVPAVAVSHDSGGSWQVSTLTGPPGSWAQVSVLGDDTYAAVVSLRGGKPHPETLSINSVSRSSAGGAFLSVSGKIGTVIGDVVPLRDGRLLAAGPDWFLSSDVDGDLVRIGQSLPYVYRLQATPGGLIALDLFDGGWTAMSRDGEDWQKVNIR